MLGCGNIQVIPTSAFRGLWSKQEFPSPPPPPLALQHRVFAVIAEAALWCVCAVSPPCWELRRAESRAWHGARTYGVQQMLVEGDAMPSRLGPGGAGVVFSHCCYPCYFRFPQVIFYLICTACDVTCVSGVVLELWPSISKTGEF